MLKSIKNILTLILFLLISSPFIKLATSLIYLVLAGIKGIRVRILPNIIILITIILITLFSPAGLEILNIRGFSITLGALFNGVYKASLLIGTLYLSKIILSTNIRFPGRIGTLVESLFFYFNQMTSGKRIKGVNLIEELDQLLLGLNHKKEKNSIKKERVKDPSLLLFITTLILLAIDITLLNK